MTATAPPCHAAGRIKAVSSVTVMRRPFLEETPGVVSVLVGRSLAPAGIFLVRRTVRNHRSLVLLAHRLDLKVRDRDKKIRYVPLRSRGRGTGLGWEMSTSDRLLKPSEVAAVFRVDPKTVTRWAVGGQLPSVRTPGGHHRFRYTDVMTLLNPDLPEPTIDLDAALVAASHG